MEAVTTPTKRATLEGFSTPPQHRSAPAELAPPCAPRKMSKKQLSPVISPSEDSALFTPSRRLAFGPTEETPEMPPVECVDWDSFTLENASRRRDPMEASTRNLLRAVRVICSSGLEVRGECTVEELQQVLAQEFPKAGQLERVMDDLRTVESRWIQMGRTGGPVLFPGEATAAAVISRIRN